MDSGIIKEVILLTNGSDFSKLLFFNSEADMNEGIYYILTKASLFSSKEIKIV